MKDDIKRIKKTKYRLGKIFTNPNYMKNSQKQLSVTVDKILQLILHQEDIWLANSIGKGAEP